MTVRIALAGPALTALGVETALAPVREAIDAGEFVLLDFSAVEAITTAAAGEIAKLSRDKWNPVGMSEGVTETWVVVNKHMRTKP